MTQCRAQFFDHTECMDKSVCNKAPTGIDCPDIKITPCPRETEDGSEYCTTCLKVRGILNIKSPTMIEVIN